MKTENTILVTGGAGFIGSCFVRNWFQNERSSVVNLDLLTYAGSRLNLSSVEDNSRHSFIHGDIGDSELVRSIFNEFRPWAVINLAAQTHVDRSIESAEPFIKTNVYGTFRLLEEARVYWCALDSASRARFRFLHVSTDEVFGSLSGADAPVTETAAYAPNSPYAASKASSDHLVRSYNRTFGLPTVTTHCGNNFGPYQFPEKLIPLTIVNALSGKPLPVYGDGLNIRDWIYVDDHCAALRAMFRGAHPGATYNIGAGHERKNLDVVQSVCGLLDEVHPRDDGTKYERLIEFVVDRPGHDLRYALNCAKAHRDLNWRAVESFESGVRKTVLWFLRNREWVEAMSS